MERGPALVPQSTRRSRVGERLAEITVGIGRSEEIVVIGLVAPSETSKINRQKAEENNIRRMH